MLSALARVRKDGFLHSCRAAGFRVHGATAMLQVGRNRVRSGKRLALTPYSTSQDSLHQMEDSSQPFETKELHDVAIRAPDSFASYHAWHQSARLITSLFAQSAVDWMLCFLWAYGRSVSFNKPTIVTASKYTGGGPLRSERRAPTPNGWHFGFTIAVIIVRSRTVHTSPFAQARRALEAEAVGGLKRGAQGLAVTG